MKFGRNLPRNQVPEWSSAYIDYKGLKKLIKAAAETVRNGGKTDLTGFFYALDRNLEDVDGFYNKKNAELARRLKLLHDRYGGSLEVPNGIDRDEIEELMAALLELRGKMRQLSWYAEVNRRGFVKITKKLDKKLPNTRSQRLFLESRVDPKPFATNVGLSEALRDVNDWLSKFGENNIFNDASSIRSTTSLRHVSSKSRLNVPTNILESIDTAIRSDDSTTLVERLMEAHDEMDEPREPNFQKLLLNLLQRAISCRSKICVDAILDMVDTLEEERDINQRNCLHRLVIAIGRAKTTGAEQEEGLSSSFSANGTNYIMPAAPPAMAPPHWTNKELDGVKVLGPDDESVIFLRFLLGHLRERQQPALKAKDSFGRMPLHYAAQFGFVIICQTVIKYMQEWGQFNVSDGIDSPAWQDNEGWAPLHLSVLGGHPLTTKTLLEAENWKGSSDSKAAARKAVSKSSAVLALATKSNFHVIVEMLVDAGVDINYQDEQGESALHVAARFGHEECARALIKGSATQRANTELAEHTFSWTPLFIACVDGHLGIVEILIDAGADLEKSDSSGWTAKEHAALRGHMDIASRLAEVTSAPDGSDSESSTFASPEAPPTASLEDRRSGVSKETREGVKVAESFKTFGHRYLTDQSMILVSLGSMDTRKNMEAVKLDQIPLSSAHATQLDTALSVVISAVGASGDPMVIDLPVQDNVSTDPVTFTTPDASKVKVLFDIIPTYAGSKDRIVGRGVAMLSSIKPSIGSKRISLQGDLSVPIVAANTLEVIGTVNFNFLIITPFTHPNMSITEKQMYWKSMASTMVIGHRGLGKNMTARKSLQLGENTLQSFIAAANLGASYVEFDVQLTKDHVPVIYHDFLVSETGIDAPVHTLTLEQFLHVSETQRPKPRKESPAESRPETKDDLAGLTRRAQRSMSVGGGSHDSVSDMTERMKHTRDFKQKGYKGNSRGHFIQAPFTTLEEMFKKLPESIGFNIELKYPMLHESEEHEMDTYAVELNSFVDTILNKIYDLGKKRKMIFSSFNPDICLLLSFKQPSIPILFLTDAGTSPVGDVRASSLQEAIRFASRWNLLGVVSAAEPLVISPRLVKVVKESGLVCVSYGAVNNDPEKVKLQVKEGIDAVIVDSVLAIRQGLTGSGTASTAPSKPGSVAPSGAATPVNAGGFGPPKGATANIVPLNGAINGAGPRGPNGTTVQ